MARTATPSDEEATARSGRRTGLDREDVVAAALDLVEREGAAALSMRRLATELDVGTPTIYWHVGSRDELVLAVIQQLAAQQALVPIDGTTPRERVASAARNIWRNALAHRNVTALASQVGATTLLELPLEVALVAELDAAGVRGAAARDATRAILMTIAGFLVGAWRRDDVAPPELRSAALWSSTTDERIDPSTIAAMSEAPDLDALFETSLRAIVDSFVPEHRPRRSGRGGGTR